MIQHFNLLDKVWLIHSTQINEAVVISKPHSDPYGLGSLVTIVLNNESLEVSRNRLFYTKEEALRDFISELNSKIHSKEQHLGNEKQKLTELYNLRDIRQSELESEQQNSSI